jgi:Mn-containing catalase
MSAKMICTKAPLLSLRRPPLQLTTDTRVREMLAFLLARDTMHQNQWLAAIKELEEDGLEETPCPSNSPQELEKTDVSYVFINASEGEESKRGGWAKGASPDGKGKFSYAKIRPLAKDDGTLGQVGSAHVRHAHGARTRRSGRVICEECA